MIYNYKSIDIPTYINSLYKDGLVKSEKFTDEYISEFINQVGIFKFKGYVKAFRGRLSDYSIDDIIYLYNFDRDLSISIFKMIAKIEIKLKTFFIESVYKLTDNPFCYLIANNHKKEFQLSNDSLYSWEIKENKKQLRQELYSHYRDYYLKKYNFKENKKNYLEEKTLIQLDFKRDINYPPLHYFIESATLGAIINLVSNMQINDNELLKLVANKFGIYNSEVFLSYLLRLKELRNRCAHNGRLFNRNYRSMKAIGIHKKIRKKIFDHRLLDVYYTLYFLLENKDNINSFEKLKDEFIDKNFINDNKKCKSLF
ncbi:MAG: Unknown protein [uncultured Campylobacterales bacterium]|uniref:Abortive infection bacteriophage resistance protein n=1 Tax=uncultured Campylobacterales bacterium TaxID=352960 RepID=A0A6S6SW69_9BACT|nr:MAG: Unknown protein [uncultured Campylobacterales bacterium]